MSMTREQTEALISEVLEVYPEKAKKDRKKHLAANDTSLEQSKKCITSNRKSLPGVMTIRGCAYAGSKGAVIAMTRIAAHALGRHNINVNAICPGVTRTDLYYQVVRERAEAHPACALVAKDLEHPQVDVHEPEVLHTDLGVGVHLHAAVALGRGG